MLSEKMEQALNDQVNAEIASAYIYFSMVAYFESLGLSGFSSWMRAQTLEELTHAEKIFTYINERGGRAIMKAIPKPQSEWDTPHAAFEAAFQHELMISGRINKLVDLALKESDHATNNFLQWFVAEQVEEEAAVEAVVHKLKLIEDTRGGLFMLDKELGARVFATPAQEE